MVSAALRTTRVRGALVLATVALALGVGYLWSSDDATSISTDQPTEVVEAGVPAEMVPFTTCEEGCTHSN